MEELRLVSSRLSNVGDVKALLEGLIAHAPVAFQVYRADGHCLLTNRAFRQMFGSEPPPEYNLFQDDILDRQGYLTLVRRAFAGETLQLPVAWYDARELKQLEVKEGRRLAMQATLFPIFDAERVVRHVAICIRDVTSEEELKVAHAEARVREERLRLAMAAGRMMTVDTNLATGRVVVSDNAREVLRLPATVPVERSEDWLAFIHPEDAARIGRERLDRSLPENAVLDRTFRLVLPDTGEVRWVERRGRVSPAAADGDGPWVRGILMDVTDRVRAEEALRESEAMYRTQFEAAPEAIVTLDVERGMFVEVNENAVRLLGYSREQILRLDPVALSPPRQPDGRLSAEAAPGYIASAIAGERPVFEWVHRNAAGEDIPCEIRLVRLPAAGRVLCRGSIIDISARKRAEAERLRLEEALRRTEEQLRQSMKMEAIGRLAGGIAHDFNNLLSVVLGYSDMLLATAEATNPIAADLREIRNAAERAAHLTGALLAFSRQQVLEPAVVDLGEIVRRMDKMLRRVIGEDITLRMVEAPGLGKVKVDPGQIEQVIMNLAVNARDAMPSGGSLTIETAELTADEDYVQKHPGTSVGRQIMLAVTDTGVGIPREVQPKIFDPFFTTKERGKGTGLGLSTVFGIVRQSGGHIWVYSEPGRGTTFKIYFPRCDEGEAPAPAVTAAPPTLRGTETLLLVEDDEQLRVLGQTILTRNGYQVIAASGGAEALAACASYPGPIDLLVTDVVMPHMNGRQLAEQAVRVRPNLAVLYVSGYTDNTIVHHGVLDPGIEFLQKPITPDALLRKIREVLDGRAAWSPPGG
jgi:PAS domain S-box-containing protein